ncbi:unnamed protein product [Meloidogyne enterolobii]|uniref:Uncharacterized protein n=1 Tax=Meloidogyne enterolobii TaxID=390850 RepID=A0ACB1A049_MELEN
MRVYAKIILQTSFCDLALLIFGHLVQPIIFVADGIAIVIENGIVNNWERPWNILIYDFWFFISLFVSVGVAVQFIYRYLILCRDIEIKTGGYFLILTIAAIAEGVLLSFFYWIGYPSYEAKIENEQILRILGEAINNNTKMSLRPTLYGNRSDIRWVIWLACFFLYGIFCYLIIWFCFSKIVDYIRKNLKQSSTCPRVNELNRQMTMNMAIQASIPVLDILVFMFVTFASIVDATSDWFICLTMLMGPIINWIPVLNPLATIITVAPYRRTLIKVGPSLPPAINSAHPPSKLLYGSSN